VLEPIDTVVDQTSADIKALARLFRIQCPSNSNQYAFGITKEGRVFLHVPKSTGTVPDESGKSVDANFQGKVKVVAGMDQSRTSLDFSAQGGIKANIGSFISEDPDNTDAISIDLTLAGKIRTTYVGTQGRESVIGGNDFRSIDGTDMNIINGNSVYNVGGAYAMEATTVTLNAGSGGMKQKIAGDLNQTVLGNTNLLYAKPEVSAYALGLTETVIAGVDSTLVLAGGITRTVVAGTGITDTVMVGNFVDTVATGNMSFNVGAGNLSATVGSGNLSLTCAAGAASLIGGPTVDMISSGIASITAPLVRIGPTASVGFAVAGIPGPPSVAMDYITGLPLQGQSTIMIG
jgi:hypothetical protein